MPKTAKNHTPKGYRSVTPYLYVRQCARAIAFYKKAFKAVELMRMPGLGGSIMHAEIGAAAAKAMAAMAKP